MTSMSQSQQITESASLHPLMHVIFQDDILLGPHGLNFILWTKAARKKVCKFVWLSKNSWKVLRIYNLRLN